MVNLRDRLDERLNIFILGSNRRAELNLLERDTLNGCINGLEAEKVIIKIDKKLIYNFYNKFCDNFLKVDYSRITNIISY